MTESSKKKIAHLVSGVRSLVCHSCSQLTDHYAPLPYKPAEVVKLLGSCRLGRTYGHLPMMHSKKRFNLDSIMNVSLSLITALVALNMAKN